jgi:hypothetical protein
MTLGMLTLTVVLNLQALHFLLYALSLLCLSLVPEQPNILTSERLELARSPLTSSSDAIVRAEANALKPNTER